MSVRNTFYDSVGGISGEGLVHIEMTQRKDFNTENKEAEFEVSERLTVTINTFLRMHQAMGRVVEQLEKGVIKKRGAKKKEEINKFIADIFVSKPKNAFAVRCHEVGDKEKQFYRYAESYFGKENTFFVINNDPKKIQVPDGFNHIIFHHDLILSKDTLFWPRDCGWKCGDYCYYAMHNADDWI